MTDKIFFPAQPVQPIVPSKRNESVRPAKQGNFSRVLDKEINQKLVFSQHAQQRLKSRNIELSQNDLDKLQQAVGKARQKGSRDSLVLIDDVALVVSIKNNTVVTAVDGESLRESVFTNIDSAVIV